MNATTGEPGYTSLDLVFTKAIEPLKLHENDVKAFKSFYATLQQAAPRLCQNVLLLTVVLNDIAWDARGLSEYRLTTKHIAHAASIERTLGAKTVSLTAAMKP